LSEPLVLQGPEGSITLLPGALTQLVVTAAESVGGARVRRPKRSVQLEHRGGSATVSLGLSVANGASLPNVARDVQERVAAAISSTCGLDVEAVNVLVEAVA
jgi:Asp23 family, cell envelope-related function